MCVPLDVRYGIFITLRDYSGILNTHGAQVRLAPWADDAAIKNNWMGMRKFDRHFRYGSHFHGGKYAVCRGMRRIMRPGLAVNWLGVCWVVPAGLCIWIVYVGHFRAIARRAVNFVRRKVTCPYEFWVRRNLRSFYTARLALKCKMTRHIFRDPRKNWLIDRPVTEVF